MLLANEEIVDKSENPGSPDVVIWIESSLLDQTHDGPGAPADRLISRL